MKNVLFALIGLTSLAACQSNVDNTADVAFENNSKVVMAELNGWESESMDYDALYAADAVIRPTGFGSPDSVGVEAMKKDNEQIWKMFDFKLVTDPLVLLPGVNKETKKPDGSVRYYGVWQVSIAATDSSEERSGFIKLYESYDFNSDGKIIYQQTYGDFGGLFEYLTDDDEDELDNEDEK